MTRIRIRLLLFISSTALYPLLAYKIVSWINALTYVSRGGDAAGAGLDKAYSYILGMLFWSILVFIVSTILAQWLCKAWWLGLASLAAGICMIWSIEQGKQYMENNRLYPYERYYDNGQLWETGTYIGDSNFGDKQGPIKTYNTEGVLESVYTYKRGRTEGPCELYYPNGKIKAKGNSKEMLWNNDEQETFPDGLWTYYFEDGSIADERTYKKGKLIRSKNYTLFFDDDMLICTLTNRMPFTGMLNQTGIVGKDLFPDLFTAQVISGYPEGRFDEYHSNGNRIFLSTVVTFKDGKMNGELKKFHENGQLMATGFYVESKLEGECTYYYADSIAAHPHGPEEYQCDYSDNEQHGIARWYYPDGKIKQEARFLNGKPNGISREYSPDGTLRSEDYWTEDNNNNNN